MLPGPGWPAFTASWFAPLPAVPACCIADLLDCANINSCLYAQLTRFTSQSWCLLFMQIAQVSIC